MQRHRSNSEGARSLHSELQLGDAPRGFLRPIHRTALTIFTGALIGLILVTTTLVLIHQPALDVTAAHEQVDRIEGALRDAYDASYATTTYFALALTAPSTDLRLRYAGRASLQNDRSTKAWDVYRRASLNLPHERALAKRYETLTAQNTQGLIGAMQIPTSDPRLLAATFTEQSSNLARLTPVVKIMKMYEQRERTLLGRADSGLDGLPTTIIITDLVLTLIWAPIIFLVMRGAGAEERMLRAAVRQRREESRRSELDAEIQQALDMTRTENAAYAVVSDALRICVPPDLAAEFLVADSSRDHFRQVSSTVPEGDPSGCAVGGPGDCPSAVRGQTHTFRSSARLDACPHLRVRANDTCSAVCVPVAIAGRSIGVFHVTAPNDAPPSEHTVQDLELVARKAGERLGMLRAFARTETEAHTDPLTGLLNRRSLESRVQELADLGSRYTIGFADLDHFKSLNTQFGHDAGDRALRIFSRTVRDAIRPYDLAARWGGEEFVVVFPDCGVADAKTVAERVRHLLAQVLEHGDAPQFTVSIGLAEAHIGSTFRDVVARADAALMEAKAAGRDRVVVSDADAGKLFTLPDPETPVAATGT